MPALAAKGCLADSRANMQTFLAFIATLCCLCQPAQAEKITVFAAASLRHALTEIAAGYGSSIVSSFGGSGTLARQIAAGAPVDAVVLAHRDWANWLEVNGHLVAGTIGDVAGGKLVLVGGTDAPVLQAADTDSLLAALDGGRLAMGQRNGVPAGAYARDWLRHIGAWDMLSLHLAETDNVRAALALVAQGAAPLGVVYASDAVAEPRVRIVYAIPPEAHAPIRYPAAAVTEAGRAFVDYLHSDAATKIFQKYGFSQ